MHIYNMTRKDVILDLCKLCSSSCVILMRFYIYFVKIIVTI